MKLIFVLGVQIVLVYGQPIFTPMAGHVGVPVGAHVGAPAMGGHFGLPIDTLGNLFHCWSICDIIYHGWKTSD